MGNTTQFNNDVLEYLCDTSNRLTFYQNAVLLAIIRATWGFRKAESRITAGQISKMTGIIKNHVFRTLKQLEERGIITRQNGIIGVSLEGVTKHGNMPK
jgi:phage replication O-like protein O